MPNVAHTSLAAACAVLLAGSLAGQGQVRQATPDEVAKLKSGMPDAVGDVEIQNPMLFELPLATRGLPRPRRERPRAAALR